MLGYRRKVLPRIDKKPKLTPKDRYIGIHADLGRAILELQTLQAYVNTLIK